MRRFYHLSIILFFVVHVSKGQSVFNPYKLDNVEWQELEAVMDGPGSNHNYYYNFYRLCGDTIYDSTLYKKVYYGYIFSPTVWLPPWQVPKSPPYYSFYCFFRQDSITKSNYYRMPSDTSDRLMISYNLNVGDTMKQGWYSYHGTGVYWTVKKKDSLFYAGRKLNIFYTDTTYNTGMTYCGMPFTGLFLVEGLGHCFGMFYGYNIPFEFWNTEDSLSFNASCDSMLIGVTPSQKRRAFNIYPNPSDGGFEVETADMQKQTLEIFDVSGKLVHCAEIMGSTRINLSSLPEGMYGVRLLRPEGILSRRIIIAK